jgi:hypothetical protein
MMKRGTNKRLIKIDDILKSNINPVTPPASPDKKSIIIS